MEQLTQLAREFLTQLTQLTAQELFAMLFPLAISLFCLALATIHLRQKKLMLKKTNVRLQKELDKASIRVEELALEGDVHNAAAMYQIISGVDINAAKSYVEKLILNSENINQDDAQCLKNTL